MPPKPMMNKISAFKIKIGSETAPHQIIPEPEAIGEIGWALWSRLKVLECAGTHVHHSRLASCDLWWQH